VSYPVIKALHIISVISWFAGLFYIFRLYVYHVENRDSVDITALLQVMERRLYRAICTPAMVATSVFGLWMLYLNPQLLRLPWFHVKLASLGVLFGYHFYSGKVRTDLASSRFALSSRQCRLINEVPTLLMVLIVVMVVVKPSLELFSGQ